MPHTERTFRHRFVIGAAMPGLSHEVQGSKEEMPPWILKSYLLGSFGVDMIKNYSQNDVCD